MKLKDFCNLCTTTRWSARASEATVVLSAFGPIELFLL